MVSAKTVGAMPHERFLEHSVLEKRNLEIALARVCAAVNFVDRVGSTTTSLQVWAPTRSARHAVTYNTLL
jgi:hypothetical protein